MSVYIKSITLTKLLTILLLILISLTILIAVTYKIHSSLTTVSANVTMGRFKLGGLKKEEVTQYLESIAEQFYFDGQEAYIDPETKSLIPHLNGCSLDIEKTTQRIV